MPTKPATKRGRGRPAYAPTATQRAQVAIGAGGGMRHEDIAIALGISRETLEKHFRIELSQGANQRRLQVKQALFTAAKKGSSAAAKAYLAIEPEFIPPPHAGDGAPAPVPASAAPVPAPPAVAAPAPRPRGKKEQQAADAVGAARGTEWDGLLPGSAPLQ